MIFFFFWTTLVRLISSCLFVLHEDGERERADGATKTKAVKLDASNDLVRGYRAEQSEPERSLVLGSKQRLLIRQNNETMSAAHTPHSTRCLKRINSPKGLIKMCENVLVCDETLRPSAFWCVWTCV